MLMKLICYLYTDIDECSLSNDNCHPNSTCANIDGSFLCICGNGHFGNAKICQGSWKTEIRELNIPN